MGSYIPFAAGDEAQMLAAVGVPSAEALYEDIPANLRCKELGLPPGRSELEVRRIVEGYAEENTVYRTIMRGAGAYRHYIPAIVKQVAAKETFVTAYTPYQAEISQGVLQIIFEFQSEICMLTGLEVSNASVYDGATAAAEATIMCRDRKRQRVLMAPGSHPDVLAVVRTYCASADATLQILPQKDGQCDLEALKDVLGDDVACLYLPSPNYWGIMEDVEEAAALCHAAGAKLIMGCNPIALALYKTPAELGADIAVGEGQPLGLPLAFGGPYLGFMACKAELMRRLPGRIVGQTTDADGQRCYVLTLQAREQHIRREKALSSICSNQALCALAATVYLGAMGPAGLRKTAEQCYSKAHYAAQKLAEAGFERVYGGDFFHEFLTICPVDTGELEITLEREGILGGLVTDRGVLWCCTEMNTRDEIDRVVSICREVSGH